MLPATKPVCFAGHPQVVGPNPTGLQPHFGSAAVAEAIQPLTARLAQGANISELRLDLVGLQALAGAASRGGQGTLEVCLPPLPCCNQETPVKLLLGVLLYALSDDFTCMLLHLQPGHKRSASYSQICCWSE